MKRIFFYSLVLSCNMAFAWPRFSMFTKYSDKIKKTALQAYLDEYDIKFYFLDIEVSDSNAYVSGNVLIKAMVTDTKLNIFAIELVNSMTVDSVKINDTIRNFTHNNDVITSQLANPLSSKSLFTAQVYYHGMVKSTGFFVGLSNDSVKEWNTRVTWTLSEPYKAKEWFPCKQVLADKADSTYIFLTTSNNLKAGSNGILTNIRQLPNGKKRHEWKTHYPIAYYLISFSVADYDEYRFYAHPDGGDSILVQNYVYKNGYLKANKPEIEETAKFIELFSKLVGIYPFHNEKYGHCMAPMGGGMEHQTMTTLSDFNFDMVAHELTHQWFGDNVTCSNWQDIWINEGFASYFEYLANEFLKTSGDASDWMENAQSLAKSVPTGSIYVPLSSINDENRIFDYRLTYKKGGAIIHILRNEINNDSLFFNILKSYQIKYSNTVAGIPEFKGVLEQKTGSDFTDFFNQWYYGQGYPVFDISWHQRGDTLYIYSNQTTTSNVTGLFTSTLNFRVTGKNGKIKNVRVKQSKNNDEFKIPMTTMVTKLEFDPDEWLLKDVNSFVETNNVAAGDGYFSVSPNPFNEELILYFNDSLQDREITLSDVKGKIVRALSSGDKMVMINTAKLFSGIYVVKINDGKNIYTRKVVKE